MVWNQSRNNGKKQNKKSISATPPRILKFVFLCFSILAIDSLAIDWFDVETEIDWSYTDDLHNTDKFSLFNPEYKGPGVRITGCSRKSGALVIPPKVDGRNVVGVGDELFLGCNKLTSVTIPTGVSYIGERSFAGCSGLTSLSIPSSVKTIGREAFANCKGLTSIEILTKAMIVDSSVFKGCDNVTSVTVPGMQCGIDFSSVVNLVISEGTESIGGTVGGFRNCPNLMSVTIPKSVHWITLAPFSGCGRLSAFTVDPKNTGYCSVNGLLIAKLGIRTVVEGVNGEVTIPSGVKVIGASSFAGRTGLTSVKIPSSVTSIGAYAFSGCCGLKSVTIPDSVTSVENGVFNGCTGLTSVTIPSGVTNLGDRVFDGCSGLKEFIVDNGNSAYRSVNGLLCSKDGTTVLRGVNGAVTIPSSVKVIGKKAFQNCSGLTSVEIPSSVKIIEDEAFSGCASLSSVTIPSSVVRIGNKVFHGCGKLRSFIVDASNTKYCSANNLLCLKGGETLICGVGGDVSIPEGVTNIGDHVFANIDGLTSVKIPSSVKSIGRYAFESCSRLHSVIISKGVTRIGYAAFYDCGALTSVVIPPSVTRIDDCAFERCRGLTSVIIPPTVTYNRNKVFRDCNGRVKIQSDIPDASNFKNSPTDEKTSDAKEPETGHGFSGVQSKKLNFIIGIICLVFLMGYVLICKLKTSPGKYKKIGERRRSGKQQP